ncbi:MAG: YgiQ family radical SAM protein [Bacteroidaceae bacterium]|nr:YgiQ family radical SAM protein [Bacteroidaceae bacterium]
MQINNTEHTEYNTDRFLPTTKKEVEQRGWDYIDVIIFSGDAYVDHPSFAAAVIGRILEAEGYRVAIVPQPDWHGDFRDFKKLGEPRLFFAIAPGCMDSMVNKYTARKRLRSEDAYTPDGRHDKRPEYPTIVYTEILKTLYPDTPVVIGGIEASMRRITHYDYWQDRLRPSILIDSGADLLIYGMGELPIVSLANLLNDELINHDLEKINSDTFHRLVITKTQPQTAIVLTDKELKTNDDDIILFSHEECLKDKKKQAQNVRHIEEESNRMYAQRIIQKTQITPNKRPEIKGMTYAIVVNPPYPPMSQSQVDHSFDLPYTRLPHPKYKGKRIPAYEMIKFSVNMHRGCFGGCAFCTISAHQGKFIVSRSKQSIMKEIKQIVKMPDFKGYLSDLGGPSANMYMMGGIDKSICKQCKRPSCIHPKVCKNLNTDHSPLLDIYHEVDALPEIKKSFIGSGVRYDLILHHSDNEKINKTNLRYARELIEHHVSGRLKVAPEHTSDNVLRLMRKPPFQLFYDFKRLFDNVNKNAHLNQQLIPYFISSHPGCTNKDMAQLADLTRKMGYKLEQVQDFTPTPMTISTETWYTGYHPYTLEPVYSAKTPEEKKQQNQYFFWYKDQSKQNENKTPNKAGKKKNKRR